MSKKPYRVTTKVPPVPDIDTGDSELNLFDPDSPDISYFNLIDDENIRLSGSKVYYYKYFPNENEDDVYMEERNKAITSEPLIMWAHYQPTPLEEDLTKFGIELKNDQIFIFNKSYVERQLGRVPIAGDVIKPFFQNQKYELFEVQEDEFMVYGVYHLNCHAKLLRDHPDIQDTQTEEEHPDIGGYVGT
jgi:hypothetical protein